MILHGGDDWTAPHEAAQEQGYLFAELDADRRLAMQEVQQAEMRRRTWEWVAIVVLSTIVLGLGVVVIHYFLGTPFGAQ